MSEANVEIIRRHYELEAEAFRGGDVRTFLEIAGPDTEIRLGGACLSVDLQQVGGDQLPVGRLSLVGEILPTGYRTTTSI